MAMKYIDEAGIRKTISVIKGEKTNGLFEVRIINGNKKNPAIGYFKDADTLISQLKRRNLDGTNVYIALNEIDESCYARTARDKFDVGGRGTSQDDIIGRHWILIDLDPVRKPEISSTDNELLEAKNKAKDIYNFLSKQGFPAPVIGCSGNGYHLLYKVFMKNSEENTERIKRFLHVLDVLFSDDIVHVDTANMDPSRVCKLYGTLAQKGSDTKERPHRMSFMTYVPKVIRHVDVAYIDKVNEILPEKPDAPRQYNRYNGATFDLVEWMQKYGIQYRQSDTKDGTKYILDHCPFDASHVGKDAMIFQGKNGAIGFHCFHDSCQGKTWKDVRLLYEPDAYERRWQERDRQMYGHFNRSKKLEPKPLEPTKDNPIWYTPMGIFNMPREEVHYIRTGYDGIDRKLYGLKKKGISVLTGLRSAGKSTWLDGLMLNAVQSGNTVGCYSGELDEKSFMRWMIRQAAGRNGVEPGKYEGQWNVPLKNIEKISGWLEGKFFLYNNNHGNNYSQIHREIEKKIESDKLDLVVLDNLMALDIGDFGYQVLDAQKNFVLELKQLAVKADVHILFVAHPRKTVSFLRLEDISGSGDLANAVDNAFLIHRNNEDFKIRSREMFKWKDDHVAYSGTNVIEVAKDRESGTQDWFIPLWYEPETKRLKNDIAENIVYGWQGDSMSEEEDYGFTDFEGDINEFFN